MADRDRYDWDRGREFDRDYGPGGAWGDRDRDRYDRGPMSRGADEVRSWFGDDEARRRREMDEQRDRQRSDSGALDYAANSPRVRAEHGWGDQPPRSDWDHDRGRSRTMYGDQRDFVGRSHDWSGSRPDEERGSHWTGGARDVGDEDTRRRYGSWRSAGGFAAGRPSSSFSGGYGAGSYESGSYPRAADSGWERDYNPRSAYRQGASGSEHYLGPSPGEGRWGGSDRFTEWYRGEPYTTQGGQRYGAYAGRGPRNYQRSDERVREDVNERLTIDPRIDASDIDVQVQSGEVTLGGMVDDRRTRRLAEEIIEDLPGVRDVRNELRLRQREDWRRFDERHREIGEQSRGREDGAIGHSGDPQKRDDVTTVNPKEPGKR
jgi:osmotically-inducible protein OsmY